jgi:hypothetical protein
MKYCSHAVLNPRWYLTPNILGLGFAESIFLPNHTLPIFNGWEISFTYARSGLRGRKASRGAACWTALVPFSSDPVYVVMFLAAER